MSSAQRVGVLTFHRCINYGSYWQARCLAEGLRARGHQAVLLDHHSPKVNWAEWRCALNPIPWEPGSREDRDAYRAKTEKFFSAFETLPVSEPFPLERPEQAQNLDLVVIGSDEVWNLRHPWYGGYPIFYGEGLTADRVVSYAASFGNHSATEKLNSDWSERLGQLDGISVRDANSRQLVVDALQMEPALVLDPVLQFPDIIRYAPADNRGKYVAIYGHDFPHWLTEQVRSWAYANNFNLISIGYRNGWADEQWIEAGPEEFASFIARAEAVVTNFFHGCVFSLVNNKPFVTAPSDYRFNKVRDLMGALGAEQHMVTADTPAEHYGTVMGQAPNPKIAQRIAELRQQSNAYLDAVLN